MGPSADEGKKIANKGAATVRNVLNKGEAVAGQASQATQESYSLTSEALSQFNIKFLEIARENSEATFDFLDQVVNAKDLQAIVELWMKHAQRQHEIWSGQAAAIANLGQRMTTQSVHLAAENVGRTLKSVGS